MSQKGLRYITLILIGCHKKIYDI